MPATDTPQQQLDDCTARARRALEQYMSELPGDFPDREAEQVYSAAGDLIGDLLALVTTLDVQARPDENGDMNVRIGRIAGASALEAASLLASVEVDLPGAEASEEARDLVYAGFNGVLYPR